MSITYHPQTDGQTKVAPTLHISYMGGESKVEEVDRTLIAKEEAMGIMKFHLQRAQDRMKSQADKGRKYRQFVVLKRVGKLGYELQLPTQIQIHNLFHVSQLKNFRGTMTNVGDLPTLNNEGIIEVEPITILERRLAKKDNAATVYVLVQ
ncbi:hypothetical protein Tco_0859349 [Tanacetum coccineum]|uniref:Tf2-1-like SH3-like domain-containing protein n=1 Tax=Tanacetum coccineum TaxID=301880 RepID=A0ABQ5BET8_9ASTR